MCPVGYMDNTGGNYNEWTCGADCPGGSYVDSRCNCACVKTPDNCKMKQDCYKKKFELFMQVKERFLEEERLLDDQYVKA